MVLSVLIAEAKSFEVFPKTEQQKFHIAKLLFEFNSEYVGRNSSESTAVLWV